MTDQKSKIKFINPVRWRRRVDGLPAWLCRVLNHPPRRGEGLHTWLFSTARQLHAHFSPGEICGLLKQITEGDEREIQDAVYNSLGCAWQSKRAGRMPTRRGRDRHYRHNLTPAPTKLAEEGRIQARTQLLKAIPPRWPEPDLTKIEAIVAKGPGLSGLQQQSPYVFSEKDPRRYTDWILRKLFVTAQNPDPYLCFGLSQQVFSTNRLSQWGNEACAFQFVVPSPMISQLGWTKTGRLSTHTLDNTGPRQFLVAECDFSMFARDGKTETVYAPLIRRLAGNGITVADMCASILLHLAKYLPLVMALSSGGKSEHGWFWVAGLPEAELRIFMEYAVSLGVDPATWVRSQFVRMPDGTRDIGKRQIVRYFDLQFVGTRFEVTGRT
jgi:hypothetical protein